MNAIIKVRTFPGGFSLLLNNVHVLRYLFVLYLTNLKFFKNFDMILCYIKQIMNVFIRAMVKYFHSVKDGIFHFPFQNFIFHRMKIFLPLHE